MNWKLLIREFLFNLCILTCLPEFCEYCEYWCAKLEAANISLKSWFRHFLLNKNAETHALSTCSTWRSLMLAPHLLTKWFQFLCILSSTFDLLTFESQLCSEVQWYLFFWHYSNAELLLRTFHIAIYCLCTFFGEISIQILQINFCFVIFSTLWICRNLLYTLEINYIHQGNGSHIKWSRYNNI